jgi:hypothetical protein
MREYPIGIVGESYRNDDGSDRQSEIRRCGAGEYVGLVREPENPYDSMCVAVYSERGVQIGCIPRSAGWIAQRIDKGYPVTAVIKNINRGGEGKLGVVLTVTAGQQA